ncbi:MAG: alpha/beta hydrolase [Alphaproteobacteria bacterium]|nr:alpha/beta hydrolase [Alphaproteobacteria bacterium]
MTTQELEKLVTGFRRLQAMGESSLSERRANLVHLEKALPVPKDAHIELVDAGGVAAEWVSAPGVERTAKAGADKALLYLHGGGYAFCGPGTHRLLAYNLSAATGMPCLLADYRLAPEHPYPAAVEDAVAAYGWLLAQGYPADRLAVAGDSAGGGLALATMLRLQQLHHPLPAAIACLSPWTDMTMTGASITSKVADDPLVEPSSLERCASWYLGDGDRADPLASPLLGDLSGLPPLLIQVGSEEILLDDASRLAARAQAAGVTVDYQCWDQMFHVWQLYAPMLSESRDAIASIGKFLGQHVD